MATTTLAVNPEVVTVPANTDAHEINFDAVLPEKEPIGQFTGYAVLQRLTGTSVQVSSGAAITGASAALNSTITQMIIPITRGTTMKMKGGAGSETFSITVHPREGSRG